MNKLVKFYNQNRYIIWIIILIIIAIISLIQIIDNYASQKKIIENTLTENKDENIFSNKDYSIITGKEVSKDASQIIVQFVDYCNNQEIEKAYSLLSNECKETLYPTIESFSQKYHSKLFKEKKDYLYQAWITNEGKNTYKVDFLEDMLKTGGSSSTSICDYFTVVKNNDKYELNINKFIGILDLNKTVEKDNIVIEIKRKRVYMDYETYEIEVKNKSDKNIRLDSLEKTNSVYIEDNKGQKYYWNVHEILEEDILIRRLQGKNMEIKFKKEYNPKNKIEKIVFSNVQVNELDTIEIEITL